MRRSLSVAALAAVMWPHVAVLGCAIGSTPSDGGHDAHAQHGAHAALAGPEQAQESSMGFEHEHDTTECRAIMICHTAMLEAAVAAVPVQPATPPRLHTRETTTSLETADLSADPPPPRRIA